MEETKVESEDPPSISAEVKKEVHSIETKELETKEHEVAQDRDATIPAIEPEAPSTPTSAPFIGLTKQVVAVVEGIMHRLMTYKNEE